MKTNFKKILVTGELEVKTGMHIGGGDGFSAIGAVDKVVIKDPTTKMPIIPGSSLKGKIRSLLSGERNYENLQAIEQLFGSSSTNKISKLQFFDCFLLKDLQNQIVTEIKFENSIEASRGFKANPRQNERVIKGAKFKFNLIYNINDESAIVADFAVIAEGLKLLQLDYLGGHGTRGYGRVSFNSLTSKFFDENASTEYEEKVNKIIEGCNNYAELFN